MFSPSSKARLTERDLGRFPGETLFDTSAGARWLRGRWRARAVGCF